MRVPTNALRPLCLAAVLPVSLFADTAEGRLTADGSSVVLKSMTAEPGFGDTIMLITEGPLPEGCGLFDAYSLATEGKLRGIAVTISQETKGIERAGLNALYHESWDGMLTSIGDPEVTVEQYDDETLKGAVRVEAGSFTDHTFSYEARFEVGLVRERPAYEATVSGGDGSEAARAYTLYYQAMMAGRLDDGKEYVIQEQAEQMTGEDVDFFLDMFQENPKQLTITSVSEEGDKATLQAEGLIAGCMEDGSAKATIEMVNRDGGWKVASESWEM